VNVENGLLTIRGTREEQREQGTKGEGDYYCCATRCATSFRRLLSTVLDIVAATDPGRTRHAALTSTLLPRACFAFGICTSRTPFRNVATIFSVSTPGGSAKLRTKLPFHRSASPGSRPESGGPRNATCLGRRGVRSASSPNRVVDGDFGP
jgi:hypothetical protein